MADQTPGGPSFPGSYEEVVPAEISVEGVMGEHVPDGDEDRMLQCDECTLRPRRAITRR
ncbi:hypothetical protein M2251_000160 [Rhodococcus erythropolis]|nr:hypothetical protein [Rhodococcus erythropolis]MCW2295410.1 hypothetical protein [Rhodococcus erythropolis]